MHRLRPAVALRPGRSSTTAVASTLLPRLSPQSHSPTARSLAQCTTYTSPRPPFSVSPLALDLAPDNKVLALYDGMRQGDRYSLARAITLVESTRMEHREQAQRLLSMCLREQHQQEHLPVTSSVVRAGAADVDVDAAAGDSSQASAHDSSTYTSVPPLRPAFRIGLTGAPGVGKSTFIEAFGMHLVERGHRVAVLAVDPSSSVTGGSILGDKTRMMELSKHERAYVRPSPNSGTLGGVARSTGEAMVLCEAAGYDVVLVETVGVGQSETMVADMVDLFALLVPPGGGDELQGLKKGIVELADLVLINKSDGELALAAQRTQLEYVSALKLLKPRSAHWRPEVLRISAATRVGIPSAWSTMLTFHRTTLATGDLAYRRVQQRRRWMWRQISDQLLALLRKDKDVREVVSGVEREVLDGRITPGRAADMVLAAFIGGNGGTQSSGGATSSGGAASSGGGTASGATLAKP